MTVFYRAETIKQKVLFDRKHYDFQKKCDYAVFQ
jgi:hypothetical protein